jgi:V-type H+-transporting ATPase subunit a
MKLAIILGVLQMVFGVILKGCNNIYMKSWVDFIFEFIPQIIFINAMFGWMCVLIVYKWTVQDNTLGPYNANLITAMINMGLAAGKAEPGMNGTAIMDPSFQSNLQFWLFIVAMICVPTMLLVKPLILIFGPQPEHKAKVNSIYPLQDKNHGHIASEIFVHQMIETIE